MSGTASHGRGRPSLPSLAPPRGAALDGLEWLVTNGLGGFASGRIAAPASRRHHGLFVPNLHRPRGRHVLLPRLDDAVCTAVGEVPAWRAVRGFRLDGTIPVWRIEVDGTVLERAIVMPHGRNATCIRWRLVAGPPRPLRLRPYVGARRLDEPLRTDERSPVAGLAAAGDALDVALACGATVRLRVGPRPARFVDAPLVDRDVAFATERDRGYAHLEHQYSPGCWLVEPDARGEAWLCASLADEPEPDAAHAFDAERARLGALLAAAGGPRDDALHARLVLAADAFVVRPGSRDDADGAAVAHDEDFRSVMAGYPWFNDWGRDTMIALEGLTLATGRHAEARAILRTFARYVRDGLIPNLFPEGGRDGLYHTADATLWWFHAIGRYLERTGDAALLRELRPVLRDVLARHREGTRFGIGMDPADGLLRAGADGCALTWMDARMDDWVVTPRRGKPVEIQALWYHALRSMAGWSRALGEPDDGCEALAGRVAGSFERRFWSAARGHLLDVVDGPDGDDASLRPNQLFAISLPHPVLGEPLRRPVLDAVGRALATPFGLRTLAPGEPGYRPRYEGDLSSRDGAYHQGTVWPWLIGPWVDAWERVHGPGSATPSLLGELPGHLLEACVGQVSEVFDAQPPHRPGGCVAQAWSVAELLRAWHLARRA